MCTSIEFQTRHFKMKLPTMLRYINTLGFVCYNGIYFKLFKDYIFIVKKKSQNLLNIINVMYKNRFYNM